MALAFAFPMFVSNYASTCLICSICRQDFLRLRERSKEFFSRHMKAENTTFVSMSGYLILIMLLRASNLYSISIVSINDTDQVFSQTETSSQLVGDAAWGILYTPRKGDHRCSMALLTPMKRSIALPSRPRTGWMFRVYKTDAIVIKREPPL